MGAQPGVTRARAGGKYTYSYVGTNVRGGRWHCSFADRSINRAAGLYCCPRVPTARSLRVLILINFWKQILLFHADAASKEKRDFAPLCFVRKSLQRAVAAPLGCEAGLCGAALRAGGRGRGGAAACSARRHRASLGSGLPLCRPHVCAKLSHNDLKTGSCVGLQGTLLIWTGKNRRCL